MLVTAIAGVPYQNGQFPRTLALFCHSIQGRVHARREIEQLAAYVRMLTRKIAEIAARREYAPYSPLRDTTKRVEKAEFQPVGHFVEIRAPDMPVKLGWLNTAA